MQHTFTDLALLHHETNFFLAGLFLQKHAND